MKTTLVSLYMIIPTNSSEMNSKPKGMERFGGRASSYGHINQEQYQSHQDWELPFDTVCLGSTKYYFFKSSCFLPKFHRLEDMSETGTLSKGEPLTPSFDRVIYICMKFDANVIVIAAMARWLLADFPYWQPKFESR